MPVECRSTHRLFRLDTRCFKRIAQRLLSELGMPRATLSVLLVDDAQMAQLHGKWMGEETPTDVISFPLADPVLGRSRPTHSSYPPETLGDVVISVETARRRSPGDPMSEVIRLLIHGMLHCTGYRHDRLRDRRRMNEQARDLMRLARGCA